MTLRPEIAAYVAGVIDGEGSIALNRARRAKNPTYRFVVQITNTKREWLETLQEWIGGSIYQIGGKLAERNRRPCYDLRLRAHEARDLLTVVMPYLLVKSEQARLMFRYFDLAARRRESNLPGRPSEPAVLAELDALWKQFRALNLRGIWLSDTPRGMRPAGRVCSIDGCQRPHMGRGYCKQHYKKYIERGGPAMHELACKRCGTNFTAKRSDAEFCSRQCANTDWQKRKRSQLGK